MYNWSKCNVTKRIKDWIDFNIASGAKIFNKDVYSLYIDDVNNRNINNDSNAQLVVTNDIVYKCCLANVV